MARVSISNRLPRRGEHSALPWLARLEHETDAQYLERLVTALEDRDAELVNAINRTNEELGSVGGGPGTVNNTYLLAGADGVDGEPGPPGPSGAAGAAGATGPAGTGLPGPPGLDGEEGDQGIPGIAGVAGAAGSQGIAGVTGSIGSPGLEGPEGPEGPPGPKGDTGATGPAGGAGNVGTATLNFGAFPGASDTSVAVTGQAGIIAGSTLQAWIRPVATADHSADEHWVETLEVIAGNIVPGTGFTIYGKNTNQINEPVEPGRQPSGVLLPTLAMPAGALQQQGGYGGGKGTRLYGQFTTSWSWS